MNEKQVDYCIFRLLLNTLKSGKYLLILLSQTKVIVVD